MFKELSVSKNCLRPQSVPLTHQATLIGTDVPTKCSFLVCFIQQSRSSKLPKDMHNKLCIFLLFYSLNSLLFGGEYLIQNTALPALCSFSNSVLHLPAYRLPSHQQFSASLALFDFSFPCLFIQCLISQAMLAMLSQH